MASETDKKNVLLNSLSQSLLIINRKNIKTLPVNKGEKFLEQSKRCEEKVEIINDFDWEDIREGDETLMSRYLALFIQAFFHIKQA